MSSLASTFWNHAVGHYVFLSFGSDPISKCLNRHPRPSGITAANTLRCILFGQSLSELDALYYLLNYPQLYRHRIRKLLIGILRRWIVNRANVFKSNIFFVKDDYCPKSAILVTLAQIIPVRLIGIQHGLLQHKYLAEANIYPGYRTAIEAVYDERYASIIANKKPAGSIVYVLGPPFDCGTMQGEKRGRKMLIYVSSADLQFKNKRIMIASLMRICASIGCDFFVRPHPSESKSQYLSLFPIATETREALYNRDATELILIGFYSTLLYEAGNKGFRTIWIASNLTSDNLEHYPEIAALPNSIECTEVELTANWLWAQFACTIRHVDTDPIRTRLIEMVENLFPDLK